MNSNIYIYIPRAWARGYVYIAIPYDRSLTSSAVSIFGLRRPWMGHGPGLRLDSALLVFSKPVSELTLVCEATSCSSCTFFVFSSPGEALC